MAKKKVSQQDLDVYACVYNLSCALYGRWLDDRVADKVRMLITGEDDGKDDMFDDYIMMHVNILKTCLYDNGLWFNVVNNKIVIQ